MISFTDVQEIKTPLFVAVGEADRVIIPQRCWLYEKIDLTCVIEAKEFATLAGSDVKEFKEYPGMFHDVLHEIDEDMNKRECMSHSFV